VSGRRVLWFQFAVQSAFCLPEDERTTTDILRHALATVVTASEVLVLEMLINGIDGGVLGKDDRAQSESQALAVLEQRFASDTDLRHMMEIPDFQLYLRRKAASRVKTARRR
jgi:hypothetical protein